MNLRCPSGSNIRTRDLKAKEVTLSHPHCSSVRWWQVNKREKEQLHFIYNLQLGPAVYIHSVRFKCLWPPNISRYRTSWFVGLKKLACTPQMRYSCMQLSRFLPHREIQNLLYWGWSSLWPQTPDRLPTPFSTHLFHMQDIFKKTNTGINFPHKTWAGEKGRFSLLTKSYNWMSSISTSSARFLHTAVLTVQIQLGGSLPPL